MSYAQDLLKHNLDALEFELTKLKHRKSELVAESELDLKIADIQSKIEDINMSLNK